VTGDLAPRVGDRLAGADGRLERAEVAADVADQVGQIPVGGGGHVRRQVGTLEGDHEQAGLVDHLVTEAAVLLPVDPTVRLFAVRP
jgi:hypothetical protein